MHTTVHHGRSHEDPYAWLRDQCWKEALRDPNRLSTAIRRHLDAENEYAAAVLAPLLPWVAVLRAEMELRVPDADETVPQRHGPYAYWQRFRAGAEQPLFCRHGDDGVEEMLFDAETAARAAPGFRLGDVRHSPDHTHLAVCTDATGDESFTVSVYDLRDGGRPLTPLALTAGQVAWANDSRTLFFVAYDEDQRPRRVYRRAIDGTAGDELVYEDPDPGFFIRLGKSESGRYITISSSDHRTSEVWLIDADAPATAPRCVRARRSGVLYQVSHQADRLLVLHNREAPDFEIAEIAGPAADGDGWRTVVAHRAGVLIRDMLMVGRHLLWIAIERGRAHLMTQLLEGGIVGEIALDDETCDVTLIPGMEPARAVVRFTCSSPRLPSRVLEYDLERGERVVLKSDVIAGHDPDRYIVRVLDLAVRDGAHVPVTVLHARDLVLDGSAPLLLHGYGAYGMALRPRFSPEVLPLVERGFVYAVAHVRGGGECGRKWYEAGTLGHKKRSFEDFIDVAEQLIARGYTSRGRIVAHGGSAGGMVIAVALNQRPELFAAAIADVPFVDVLCTMLDEELPLTPREWPEWGNPRSDVAAYDYIRSYSPIENVSPQAYPDLLVTAGIRDPRVTYWEPAKWVATLRAAQTGPGVALLRTDMSSGHLGQSGRYQALEQAALRCAFAWTAVSGSAR